MASELELEDSRLEFIADFVIKTTRCKPDRFMKLLNVDETKLLIMEWFDNHNVPALIIASNQGGVLTAHNAWPSNPKQIVKACYFVKKSREPLSKDVPLRHSVLYGDMSNSPLEQLSTFVDEVGYCTRHHALCNTVWYGGGILLRDVVSVKTQ